MADRLEEVDQAALEQRLQRFYKAYYSELRQQMSQYPAVAEIFPYYLTGFRRIVAVLTRDGLATTHWPAECDSFDFRVSPEQTVRDITKDRAIVAPNGYSVEFFPEDPDDPEKDFDGAFQVMGPEAVYDSKIIRPDWVRLDVAAIPTLEEELHSEEKARGDATKDVLISANAYLMGLAQVPPDQKEVRVIAELEVAINEFEKVLETHANDEKKIQLYLSIKRNLILLDPSALSIRPKVQLGSEYELDFTIEEAKEQYVLIEIERPALPLLTHKGRPRAELTHAQQQVKDWFEWISKHSEYARSILPGISEPKGWVVMGRRSSIPAEHANVLARDNAESRRITTKTYDDLLDRAKQHLHNLRSLQGCPG